MILLIAYGNSLRRDDGAGLQLAERLAAQWQDTTSLRHIVTHQLLPELAEEIAQDEVTAAVFVDTQAVAPTETGQLTIQRLNATPVELSLGHYLNPITLLIYAERLYGYAPPAWLITAPGLDFAHGEGLSHLAQAAIELSPEKMRHLLLQIMKDVPQHN